MTPQRLCCAAGLLLAGLLLVAGGVLLVHAHRQRSIAQSLLKFDGSVHALYGDYQYAPPPAVTEGGLSLVLGRSAKRG